jgi:hypothetical protein
MWKKIGIGLAVLVIIIAGAAWYLFANLDHYIKAAIEKYGSSATQASVTIDSVNLSITSGTGAISGLIVGNPQGFYTPNAIAVGTITVQLDTSTLRGTGPIVIKEIDINQPHVTYEVNGGGKGLSLHSLNFNSNSNLAALQRNVQAYAAGPAGTTNPAPPSTTSTKPARKEIIDNLYVTGGQVGVSAPLLQGKTLTVPLPSIHLTGIGQASGGATAAQIAEQVLTAITNSAALTGAASLMKEIGAPATGPLGNAVGGKLKSLF